MLTNLTQGCSPVGTKHRITKSRENVAYGLDGLPALEVLMQDMQITTIEELTAKADSLFAGLCIAGSDRSDYRVRNLVGVDPEHKLFAINDYLVEGEELIFCTRNEDAAIRDMQQMLDKLGT